eukprot:scaffold31810_cov36-Phaeocystis_antarctica.AAC.1
MEGVAEDADAELGAGDVRQLDGAGETLVLLGIVVLEADLQLDRLHELHGGERKVSGKEGDMERGA